MNPGISLGRVLSPEDNRILITTEQVRALQTLGIKKVRIEASLRSAHSWHQVLPLYAAITGYLEKHGIDTLLLITPQAVWGATQEHWNAPLDSLEFHTFVHSFVEATMALHDGLSAVQQIELWNEPNAYTASAKGGHFTGGTYIAPANLAHLLTAVANEMPRIVPVLLGGLFAHNIHGEISENSSGAAYLKALVKAGIPNGLLSGIGYHPYFDQGGGFNKEHLSAQLIHLRSAGNYPIHITETGWSTRSVSEAQQAQNLRTLFEQAAVEPRVESCYWFLLDDQEMTTPQLNYGLRSPGGNAKPAFAVLKEIASRPKITFNLNPLATPATAPGVKVERLVFGGLTGNFKAAQP